MRRNRKPKRQYTPKAKRGACQCKAQNGDPKTLFAEHWQASKLAGDTMGSVKMWEVNKCPYPDSDGYHIATVRWNPWNSSAYLSQEAES
jgi:hypothetical protein